MLFLTDHTMFVHVSGLAELASRKYKPAAKCFLQASFDHCDCPEVRALSWSHCSLVLEHLQHSAFWGPPTYKVIPLPKDFSVVDVGLNEWFGQVSTEANMRFYQFRLVKLLSFLYFKWPRLVSLFA